MTFTAVGSLIDQTSGSFTLTPSSAAGDFIMLAVGNFSNSTVFASSLSSSNATWTPIGHRLGSPSTGTVTLFIGTVTSASAATLTVTWSGTAPAGILINGHEFHSSLGNWIVDASNFVDNASTAAFPSITPAGAGELYWGYAMWLTGGASNGATSGYTYNTDAEGNGSCYNLNCTGSAQAPTWGGGAVNLLGFAAMVQEVAGATATPVSAPPPVPPGWWPGASAVSEPGGVPFRYPVIPAYLAIPPPPPPPPPAAQMRPVPPGWFPGCDRVTAAPGGVPFDTQPQPAATAPRPYIVGLGAGSGVNRCFVDQYGSPRVWLAGEDWGLPANAGSVGTGTWQQDYQNYLSIRASQGYTVATLDPYGNSIHGGNDDGSTLDGVHPFTTPFSVFNETFWTRIDYLISLAATYGITVNLNIAYSYDFGTLGGTGTGTLFSTMTLTQATAYGVALGNRYRNWPNLIWMFGDDDNNNATLDGLFTNIAAGIRSTGDTHEMSIEYYPTGTTCVRDLSTPTGGTPFNFGSNTATYNWVYYYWSSYYGVEEAYAEPTFPTPVVWGDGMFYGDAGGAFDQQIQRNMVWWALSSGARGVTGGSEAVFPWNSSSLAALKTETWAAQQAFVVRQLLEQLPFYKLAPDVSSTLVTAGRGTHATYHSGHFLSANIPDGYVTASYVADGSLAVIYCDAAFSITINQSVMSAGYTATFVDPSNGAQTPTTTGSTYSSSGLGNNAAGNPDWLLILQGTPVVSTPGSAALSGTGTLAVSGVTIGTTAALSGAGTLTAGPQLPGAASLSGMGTLTASPRFEATAALSGVGTLTASPTSTGGATATLTGLGTLSVSGVTIGTTATLSGVGTLTAAPQLQGAATLSGLGTLTASPTLTGAATLSGAGTLTAGPQLQGAAALSGVGTLTASPSGAVTASLSGAGTLTAAWTLNVPAALSGVGTLTATPGSAATATLTGSGTLTAAPALTPLATLSGLGTLTAAPVQTLQAAAAVSGAGTLTAALRLSVTTALSGLGTLTTVFQPPFAVARSAATVTDPRDGTATVTAPATSTPGVS